MDIFNIDLLSIIKDTLLLFSLGAIGWIIFSLLKAPVPGILGTMFVIGGLKIYGLNIPDSPEFISPMMQVLLGIFIGGKINKNTIKDLRTLIKPASIIIIWTLSIVFIFGGIMHRLTDIDLYTSILSSSMGGLPEMTVIAMDTSADITIVVLIHTVRMISTMVLFPLIFKKYMQKEDIEESSIKKVSILKQYKKDYRYIILKAKRVFANYENFKNFFFIRFISILIAGLGGLVFTKLNVPAGAMVGAMIFISTASILDIKIKTPSALTFQFILIGIAINISDNIDQSTLATIMSVNLFIVVIISTLFIFMTSLLIALLIKKITNWDFPTCFLASAPSGFTVMTALAIKYDKRPFEISMLHLARIMSIKLVVPFYFMIILN